MKLKFTGTDANPSEITFRGVTFTKGKAVEVPEEEFAAKLAALEYFAEIKRGRPKHDKDKLGSGGGSAPAD